MAGQSLGQFRVERDELALAGGHVILRKDGLRRTFRHAQVAVDALLRVDHQEIRAFVKAIHRADFDAIGVLALDAVFGDNVSHNFPH
jgi:hypothetical protein